MSKKATKKKPPQPTPRETDREQADGLISLAAESNDDRIVIQAATLATAYLLRDIADRLTF